MEEQDGQSVTGHKGEVNYLEGQLRNKVMFTGIINRFWSSFEPPPQCDWFIFLRYQHKREPERI